MGSYSEQLVLFDSLSFQMFAPAPDGEGGGGGYRSGRPLSGGGGGGGGTGRETQMPMPRAADLGPQQFRVQFLQWVLATGFHLSGAKYLTAVGGDFVAVECVQWLMNQSSATDEKHIDALAEANHCTASFSSLRIYGCYQSLMKMHPLFDRAIVQVMIHSLTGIFPVSVIAPLLHYFTSSLLLHFCTFALLHRRFCKEILRVSSSLQEMQSRRCGR